MGLKWARRRALEVKWEAVWGEMRSLQWIRDGFGEVCWVFGDFGIGEGAIFEEQWLQLGRNGGTSRYDGFN